MVELCQRRARGLQAPLAIEQPQRGCARGQIDRDRGVLVAVRLGERVVPERLVEMTFLVLPSGFPKKAVGPGGRLRGVGLDSAGAQSDDFDRNDRFLGDFPGRFLGGFPGCRRAFRRVERHHFKGRNRFHELRDARKIPVTQYWIGGRLQMAQPPR